VGVILPLGRGSTLGRAGNLGDVNITYASHTLYASLQLLAPEI